MNNNTRNAEKRKRLRESRPTKSTRSSKFKKRFRLPTIDPAKIVQVLRSALRKHTVVFILLGICLLLAVISPRFLQIGNLRNILLQSSVTAIIALGLLLPILTGGIDLSVSSTAALAGAVSAGLAANAGLGAGFAISAALLLGAGIGAIIGVLIVVGKMPPFVASLAMLAIGRGLTLVYTNGRPISGLPEGYIFLSSTVAGIPIPIIFLVLISLAFHVLLSKTRFGYHVYAIGGNEASAFLAGVRVNALTVMVYCISGLVAAFAGVLLTARLWSAQPTAATGLELEAIAAVVLGGASLLGGQGTAGGTVVGALIVGVISNGLNLLQVPSYLQQVIKGAILIVAVLIDMRSRKKSPQNFMQAILKLEY